MVGDRDSGGLCLQGKASHSLSIRGQSVARIGDKGPSAYKQKYARNVIIVVYVATPDSTGLEN